jgi:hypothetical protein
MSVGRIARGVAAAGITMLAVGAAASTASAAPDAPPSFARCPTGNPDVLSCFVIQSTAGFLRLNETNVPLGDSIKIEGGIKQDENFNVTVVPPATGSALTAKPLKVPGGLLGIPLPFGADDVYATARLAGTPVLNFDTYSLKLPIYIDLDNPLIGPNCKIGSPTKPIILDTITGTTTGTPPVSGRPGDVVFPTPTVTEIQNNITVDNTFSVPKAQDCGYLGGFLINPLVNLKVGLPSPAGENATSVTSNIFLKAASDVVAGN